MKIVCTKEITEYLDRCSINLQNSEQNEYLDGYIAPEYETEAIEQLRTAGQQEFGQMPCPSLFINTDDWINSPYHTNIHLDLIQSNHFSYSEETLEPHYLFNADAIQPDIDRELKDWMKLRALDKECTAIYLYQDDSDWMMDAPSEALTNNPYAAKAKGNVLTFGLGIGYFIYMSMLNPEVKSITVIERSQDVIDLFRESLLPQFPNHIPINIVCGDAFDYFNHDYLCQYDYIYADIHQSSDDGLRILHRLLQQHLPPIDQFDFWIEDSCITPIRTLIYLHYNELVYDQINEVSDDFKALMNQVRTYFRNKPLVVNDVNTLKDFMYSRQTIREILAMKTE